MEEKKSSFPEWMKENEDGTFTITTRHDVYIMEEQLEEVMESCTKLSEKFKLSLPSLLVTRSLIGENKVTDDEFKKLKGSVSTRLKMAVTYLYDLGDFMPAHK